MVILDFERKQTEMVMVEKQLKLVEKLKLEI